MPRGGYRPNSGPQKGTKYKPRTPKPEAEEGPKVKAKQKEKAPKKTELKQRKKKAVRAEPAQPLPDKAGALSPEDAKQAQAENLTPLEYMLKIMNDPNEKDKARRDRMAALAAPFCHPRAGEGKGKKEEKESKAKAAAGGKFASMGDRLKVVK